MTATAPNYDRTVVACFNGYVTQAIINNFMPLLFVTFSATLGIDMARLSMLISVNFVTQLVVDVLAGKYVDRIGYRPCIIAAHVAAAAGLLTLGLLVGALFAVILLVGVVALRQLMHATRRDTAQR